MTAEARQPDRPLPPRPSLPARLCSALQRAAQTVFLHNGRLLVLPFLRARAAGLENIPRRGGVVVASSHASLADPVALQALVPRHLTYLMGDKYYYVPVLHAFVRFYGVVCIADEGLNKDAIRAATAVLARGRAVGIFPEGELSRDGLVHDARPGVALIAQRAGVPIVPVGLAGTGRILPPDTWRFRLARIAMAVGQPIPPEGLTRAELTGRVTAAIREAVAQARKTLAGL